jgi:hypothetical protein
MAPPLLNQPVHAAERDAGIAGADVGHTDRHAGAAGRGAGARKGIGLRALGCSRIIPWPCRLLHFRCPALWYSVVRDPAAGFSAACAKFSLVVSVTAQVAEHAAQTGNARVRVINAVKITPV